MMKIIILIASLFAFQVLGDDWAVIVAGSSTWGNYRHQADACHARKLCSRNGIPDDRIIVMVVDDIARNSMNPFPGQIFNKPEAGAGIDVYGGCVQTGDYTGSDVTVDNFIAVLTGDQTKVPSGKKVLRSTSKDNVFVNFIDHGGVGIIAFPDRMMSNTELIGALKKMKSSNMFSKLVFYLESCESGSMFDGLLDSSWGIYATTASGPDESSWGTYCPPNDVVNGRQLNTCLGDLYEVSWMENLESVGKGETLEQQYTVVKKKVDESTVMQYGDLTYTNLPVGDFVGQMSPFDSLRYTKPIDTVPSSRVSTVNSRDIPLHLAYYKYLRADPKDFKNRLNLASALQDQISRRMTADKIFMNLALVVAGSESVDQVFQSPHSPIVCGECCITANRAYHETCGGYDDYSIQYSRVIYNLCLSYSAEEISAALKLFCTRTEK